MTSAQPILDLDLLLAGLAFAGCFKVFELPSGHTGWGTKGPP